MKPGRQGYFFERGPVEDVGAEAQKANGLKPSENNATAPPCFKKNASGEPYLELSNTRRLTVREWKGRHMIDIREFYRKDECHDDQERPLTESQWNGGWSMRRVAVVINISSYSSIKNK